MFTENFTKIAVNMREALKFMHRSKGVHLKMSPKEVKESYKDQICRIGKKYKDRKLILDTKLDPNSQVMIDYNEMKGIGEV
jgi:adenine C2-methylase RlmN of 23S rRNA A2503 and tRNA A37